MRSTNAGVNVPGTEVLIMKNYPKPKIAPFGKVEMVVMELSNISITVFNFPDVRIFQSFLFK